MAGFLREEDYLQARDSFLHSLDFQVASANGGSASGHPSAKGGAAGGPARGGAPTASAWGSQAHPPMQRPAPPPATGAMPPPPPPPPPPTLRTVTSDPTVAASALVGQRSVPSGSGGLAQLADLPRIGKAGVAEGKVGDGGGRGTWERIGIDVQLGDSGRPV